MAWAPSRFGYSGGRLRCFLIWGNMLRIADRGIPRVVDVLYGGGEMYCMQCNSTECIHAGYAWSVYQRYVPRPVAAENNEERGDGEEDLEE